MNLTDTDHGTDVANEKLDVSAGVGTGVSGGLGSGRGRVRLLPSTALHML